PSSVLPRVSDAAGRRGGCPHRARSLIGTPAPEWPLLRDDIAKCCRHLLLEATCASSIDQHACITAKMYAALTPKRSIPFTASRAPIIRQCCCSVSPDAPRVLIESTE